MLALARLLFEFSASLIHTVPQLLPAVLLLTRTQNRETVKVRHLARPARSAFDGMQGTPARITWQTHGRRMADAW